MSEWVYAYHQSGRFLSEWEPHCQGGFVHIIQWCRLRSEWVRHRIVRAGCQCRPLLSERVLNPFVRTDQRIGHPFKVRTYCSISALQILSICTADTLYLHCRYLGRALSIFTADTLILSITCGYSLSTLLMLSICAEDTQYLHC